MVKAYNRNAKPMDEVMASKVKEAVFAVIDGNIQMFKRGGSKDFSWLAVQVIESIRQICGNDQSGYPLPPDASSLGELAPAAKAALLVRSLTPRQLSKDAYIAKLFLDEDFVLAAVSMLDGKRGNWHSAWGSMSSSNADEFWRSSIGRLNTAGRAIDGLVCALGAEAVESEMVNDIARLVIEKTNAADQASKRKVFNDTKVLAAAFHGYFCAMREMEKEAFDDKAWRFATDKLSEIRERAAFLPFEYLSDMVKGLVLESNGSGESDASVDSGEDPDIPVGVLATGNPDGERCAHSQELTFGQLMNCQTWTAVAQ